MPPPPEETDGNPPGLLHVVKQDVGLGFGSERQGVTWRHPAEGTGQICDLLERHIRNAGGRFLFGAQVTKLVSSQGRISAVTVQIGAETVVLRPSHVVAAIPIEFLARLLSGQHAREGGARLGPEHLPARTVVLVYLFLDEPPRFPHAWLEVTSPTVRAGRITNYAAFNGEMVPPGKTCLCVEFFCAGEDALLELSSETLAQLALRECAEAQLLDPLKCFDQLVVKLPGADPATSWRDWQNEARRGLLADVRQFENLYFVNRAGTDKATHAGLEAAGAILSGDRAGFDELTGPVVSPPFTQRAWAADRLTARR
jgi:protoporphyrinogen oxidase